MDINKLNKTCENLQIVRDRLYKSLVNYKIFNKNFDQYKKYEKFVNNTSNDYVYFNNYIKKINHILTENEQSIIYNNQYIEYIKNELDSVNKYCEDILTLLTYKRYSSEDIINKYNELILIIKNDTKDNLFDYFKFGNKNYVLYGKNGAGKTSLLKKLSTELLNTNTVVLPATRDIKYRNDVVHCNSDITLLKALSYNENGKSLFLLGKCLIAKATQEFMNGSCNEDTIITKVQSIFDDLGIDRSFYISSEGVMYLYKYKKENEYYYLNNASDGERSIIFVILVTLLAPENAFIFIDEPENHLNGALMRKLFNVLEQYRSDIKFIFATHNIHFIESQSNIELIYLEKGNRINEWEFRKFNSCDEIPLELLLSIEGTNDDIIFCEGEDHNSCDCLLYQILYPNYHIMPSNGCEMVIEQTKIINKFGIDLRKNALGIVDNDFRTNDDITLLNSSNITVLCVNEIENLFMIEDCLIKVKNYMAQNESIDEIIRKIVDHIKRKVDDIKQDFATKLFRRIHKKNRITCINNIETTIDKLNEENKESFLKLYNKFDSELNQAIDNLNYNELMRLVPGKQIINNVAQLLNFRNDKAYINLLLNLIKDDSTLKEKLVNLINLRH